MYQQNTGRGGFRGHRGGGFNRFSRPQRTGGGSRFKAKSLDPRLFVRPATAAPIEQNVITHTFADFNLPAKLLENLSAVGFTTPTAIQDQALEPMLAGRDVIGLADTGTGKTAAFILPILTKMIVNPNQTALIIAPTRELALQIKNDIRALSNGLPIYSCLLIGGSNLYRQIDELKRKPHFFIGTPGRLKDLHERRALNLNATQTVVLDEMDRMLDMGFIKDITKILSLVTAPHQTLLFSATIDERVEGVARQFLTNPLKISAKTGSTSQNVEQDVVRTNGANKIDVLQDMLRQDHFKKVLIFGRTKFGVEKLSVALTNNGFSAGAIHGNKRQSQRETVLRSFRENKIRVLIATDVAARGLDIKDITHVINYDQPGSYEDYVHRIGRTGRAGNKGFALTFVD